MNRFVVAALALIAAWGAWRAWSLREIERPPGILAAEAPRQAAAEGAAAIRYKDFSVQPLARYELTARVIGRRDYGGDPGSRIAPMDLAVGWGALSDTQVIKALDWEQSSRFATYRYEGAPPVPQEQITREMANMHLIPATSRVREQLERVRVGHLASLRGYLVEAKRDDGWQWRSSLSRTDTGNGACELMWVEDIVLR